MGVEIEWRHKRAKTPVAVVPAARVRRPPPPSLPEVKVSPFGLSFTYGGRHHALPRTPAHPMATQLPPVAISEDVVDLSYEPTRKYVSIMNIIRAVAAEHEIPVEALIGEGRSRPLVLARHQAMWRCAKENRWSFPRIGRAFNRDHTTVMYGVKRHEKRMREVAKG